MEKFYFLNNNLFNENFLSNEIIQITNFDLDITNIFNEIKELYKPEYLEKLNEDQLIEYFIKEVLKKLGWEFLTQEIQIIQGKQERPDFSLFTARENKDDYITNKEVEKISLVCEVKAINISLDNKQVKKTNPHFQIIEYMLYMNKKYGFLTNGRYWRFYDKEKFTGNKVFYEVDLQQIFENDDIEAFKYFYHIFKKDNFSNNAIEEINKKDEETKRKIEDNLMNIIYGYENNDSIFELIGKSIYNRFSDKELELIYENSLYFLFRILFIVYFEDKFQDILKKHKHYKSFSLNKILNDLKELKVEDEYEYNIYRDLKILFKILDNGDYDVNIPLFNGGLFATDKAELLEGYRLIDNKTLKKILERIYYYKYEKRDFKTLSIIHLGSIYEGLLSFKFNIAEEKIYYTEYEKTKKLVSAYLDSYDFNKISKKKNASIKKNTEYKKGDIYLRTHSNSRKTSASYYTPKDLTDFMVKEGIDKALKKYNPLDIKIIDNSCGSGNFLVTSLNYLTSKVFENIDKHENIQRLIEEEKEKIKLNLSIFNFNYEIDEFAVLKRIILKNTIYGVDINHFAIEITKLSLWIDTFVFGTPLSFIEHHIKNGNSLIGSTIEEFNDFWKNKNIGGFDFYSDFLKKFDYLKESFQELSNLKDTTNIEIENSKRIYKEIEPKINELNKLLNLLTYFKFKKIEKDTKMVNEIDFNTNLDNILNNDEISQDIDYYAKKYLFFNYEIQFPEVFSKEDKGFNLVIGNPPWEKTKFDDKDFFSEYKTNYRTLLNSEKEEFRINTLDKEYIKRKYEYEKDFIENSNEYYKEYYPYNRGSGDGNLFRFFLERNLNLVSDNGNLTYLTPSAIILEAGSTSLRKYIFDNYNFNFFYSFENRKKIFKDIDQRYKFSIFQIDNDKKNNIKVKFMLIDPTDLYNDNFINYTIDDIKLLSPEFLSLQQLKDKNDLKLLKKLYKKFNNLDINYIDFRFELNMTNDKELFYEKCELGMTNLYEGKMIWQYNPKFSESNYFLKINEVEEKLKSKEIYRLCQDIGISEKDLKDKLQINSLDNFISYEHNYYRLGFRAIASDTNERTLIFSMIPKNIFIGHNAYISIPKKYFLEKNKISVKEINIEILLFMLSIFNSLILDYIARFMIQINVSKTYIYRLPIPQINTEDIYNNEIYKKLMMNSLKLTLYYAYDEFKELAEKFDINKKDIPRTDKQIDILKIENDILVAKLYDINLEDLKHICRYFKVLNTKKPEYIELLLDNFVNY